MHQERANWASRLTGFFMGRRQLVIVLFILLVGGGTAALINLRREGFPQVPVKIVVVSTVYKGAAASEVETSVTTPLEAAIDVHEVKSFASTSSESHSLITVTLNENANLDAGLQNITTKVASVTLPTAADKPEVMQPTTGNAAFTFGLSGPDSLETLLAQGQIFAREVGQVKGVKSVTLASDVKDQVNVVFDPAKLAAAKVDQSALTSAIAANNLNLPAGSSLTLDGSRATALTAARDASIDDLSNTPLPTTGGGSETLSRVATITRSVDQNGTINRIGVPESGFPVSRPGLVYNVAIASDADIITVDHDLTAALKRLTGNGTISRDITLTRLFDDAANTTEQINEIKAGAIGQKWKGIGPLSWVGYAVGGIWLLMLAMFLFVNLRTALIAGIAIPLSFLFTLLALWAAGITLNTLTLFSMILVLGLVVDPAIVVLESIQRHKDIGQTGKAGVLAAVNSIGNGLMMATLCSIIVFTPFGIVSGVFGEIIKFIPITVIPALVASFFIPLIFLAPLAAKFIPAHHHAGKLEDEDAALWAVSRWFKRTNLFILGRTWLQILIMIVAVAAPVLVTGYLFASGKVKSAQFSKPHDTVEALVSVSFPASSTPGQIDALARKTETALDSHYEIANYYYFQQSPTGFTLFLSLIPIAERPTKAEELVKQINNDLPHDSAKQIYSSASTLSAGPPVPDFPVVIQIYEGDLTKLKAFALRVADHARGMAGVTRVSDGYTDGSTAAVSINVNKTAAAAHGLNAAAVGAQVAGLLGTQPLTKLGLGDQTVDVVASYAGAADYTTAASLGRITVATPTGPVQLSQIAGISTDTTSGNILHQNGLRYATVQAAVATDANSFKIQSDLSNWAKDQLAAAGLRSDALENKGEGDDIAKSFTNLFEALAISLLLIYLVLAFFFRSFLKPIIITFALPLSFLGVFPILAILDNEFGFLEILGIITLAGIVVNVGIFVIDYANKRVEAGVPVKEAIAEATAVRFRPIFLTKVTALGSLLPLALLSPFWRGLALVIIAGILTSGVLSLFTTPILYSWFSKLSRLPAWVGARGSRRRRPRPSPGSETSERPEFPPAAQSEDLSV